MHETLVQRKSFNHNISKMDVAYVRLRYDDIRVMRVKVVPVGYVVSGLVQMNHQTIASKLLNITTCWNRTRTFGLPV